jgi:hypothetical protein
LVLDAKGVRLSWTGNVERLTAEPEQELLLVLLEHGRIRMLSGVVPCSSWALIRVGSVRLVLTSSMTRLLRALLVAVSVLPIRRTEDSNRTRVGVDSLPDWPVLLEGR